MSWTEERVETLRVMWQDGSSASQIASKLGGVSRNAVIGKIHRLKISSEGRPNNRVNRDKQAAGSGQGSAAERRRSLARVGRTIAKIQGRQALTGQEAPAPIEAYKPFELPQTTFFGSSAVMSMTENSCKWPIGDPMAEDFRFCCAGKPSDATYCAHHGRMAYEPASRRARKALAA